MRKKERTPNFVPTEVEILMNLIAQHQSITGNQTSGIPKDNVWQDIEVEFNDRSKGIYRNKSVLRTKYINLRKAMRRNESFNDEGLNAMSLEAKDEHNIVSNDAYEEVNMKECEEVFHTSHSTEVLTTPKDSSEETSNSKEITQDNIHRRKGSPKRSNVAQKRRRPIVGMRRIYARKKCKLLDMQIKALEEKHALELEHMKKEHRLRVLVLQAELEKAKHYSTVPKQQNNSKTSTIAQDFFK